MLTTNITGNFGNCISQITTCRIIAEKLGYDWGVKPNPTHDYFNGRNQLDFMDVNFGNQDIKGIEHEYHEHWETYKHVDDVNITMYQPEVFNIKDNTILLGHNGAKGGIYQSEEYFIDRKSDIISWYQIKDDYKDFCENKLKEHNITLDDNLCVINFRGGEYRGIPNVLLRKEYWRDSINHMLLINPDMKFLVITDDSQCTNMYMPFEIPTLHIDIGFDFYVVNNAKWLIIANSSFSWWASWLNTKVNKILAPRYWARHNVSDGYWACGDQYTRCFTYVDRDGSLVDYDTCKSDALNYYKDKGLI